MNHILTAPEEAETVTLEVEILCRDLQKTSAVSPALEMSKSQQRGFDETCGVILRGISLHVRPVGGQRCFGRLQDLSSRPVIQ
ncbi:hypothetical protein CgunFtcFv8_009671 [Champsocephalus gunnari]|uniref:Uncharacterized protein n=1 Tax=Champsocephalus gunnari TaxID=52237 RepID=A0AAN8C2M3_CHAGU|nr:hypothetical protein CgunFtcFv8_009671 [Champsocephalus gunnari]